MKAVNKKKIDNLEDAKAHVAKRYGVDEAQVQLIKPHRTRWMFRIVNKQEGQPALELKPWNDFVKDYAAQNNLSYGEAMKAAAPVYRSLKEAQEKAA